MVDVAQPRVEADQLSVAWWELDAITVREGLDMFRQLLARLIPRRRPFRTWVTQATEASTHEQPRDMTLSEVYHAHAAIHGPNRLLPEDALPDPPEHPRTSETGGESKLA
jgi:hypothetical protein